MSDATETALPQPQRAIAVACLLAALVLVVMDAAMANAALPTIARSLRVTPAAAVRVVTAYQTALGMALLPSAALGESLGYRRVYTAGVALFVFAAGLCAVAPTLPLLVAARFLQGLGGSAVLSLGVALLRTVVPPSQFGRAIGWNALAVATASSAGPTLGALVLSRADRSALSLLDLPIGALVLLLARWLPDNGGHTRAPDAVSVALDAGAFGSMVLGAELLLDHPGAAMGLLLASAIALASLVRRELPRAVPLVPFDLLRTHGFRLSVLASLCCFVGQGAAMVALPFHLQRGLGHDALGAGLLLTPWPAAVALVAPFTGRLVDRVPDAHVSALGGLLLAIGLGALAVWPAHGHALQLGLLVALCGAGFGLFQVPNNRNLFLAAPRARAAAAGGMQSTARLTGQTLGAVLVTLLFASAPVGLAPRCGLGLAALATFAAGLVSLHRSEPPREVPSP